MVLAGESCGVTQSAVAEGHHVVPFLASPEHYQGRG